MTFHSEAGEESFYDGLAKKEISIVHFARGEDCARLMKMFKGALWAEAMIVTACHSQELRAIHSRQELLKEQRFAAEVLGGGSF